MMTLPLWQGQLKSLRPSIGDSNSDASSSKHLGHYRLNT